MGKDQRAPRTTARFDWLAVATALVKAAGIHDGVWQVQVAFGHSAMNTSINKSFMPTAITQVMGLQLARVGQIDPLSVDAAVVNPRSRILTPAGLPAIH